jgi:hypothetical protein
MNIQFSLLERSLIKNMMLSKSFKDIASMLERDVNEIREAVEELKNPGAVTFQEKLDAKRKVKAPRPPRVKVKSAREKKKEEEKLRKEREREIKRKNLDYERSRARASSREPKYETKAVDYSQLRSIKIDRTTTIYAKPGEDIETVKANFLKTYQKPIDRYKKCEQS